MKDFSKSKTISHWAKLRGYNVRQNGDVTIIETPKAEFFIFPNTRYFDANIKVTICAPPGFGWLASPGWFARITEVPKWIDKKVWQFNNL